MVRRLAFFLAIPGAIWAGVQILEYLRRPDLIGNVRYQTHRTHPEVQSLIERLSEGLEPGSLQAKVQKLLVDEGYEEVQLSRAAARRLSQELTAGANLYGGDRNIKTLMHEVEWLVTVGNSGEKPAEDVVLSIPRNGHAIIRRPGAAEQAVEWSGRIELGVLRPGESVELHIWPGHIAAPRLNDDVTLSYRDGMGTLQ